MEIAIVIILHHVFLNIFLLTSELKSELFVNDKFSNIYTLESLIIQWYISKSYFSKLIQDSVDWKTTELELSLSNLSWDQTCCLSGYSPRAHPKRYIWCMAWGWLWTAHQPSVQMRTCGTWPKDGPRLQQMAERVLWKGNTLFGDLSAKSMPGLLLWLSGRLEERCRRTPAHATRWLSTGQL